MDQQFNVLIVEDNEDDTELVLRFVRQYAKNTIYKRVETEADIRKSLVAEKWHLIISNYMLSTFSGLDVLKIFIDSGKEIPFIIVSGMIGEETATETVKAGATDYVLKSNLARLPGAIDRAVKDLEFRKKMRKLEQNLIQSQKMESVGRFAGGLAHDVNNVLTAITLYAEVALKQIHTNPNEAVKNILDLLKSKKTASDIIQQLLFFSKHKNEPDNSIVDICQIMTNFVPLIRRLVERKIEFKINNPDKSLFINASQTHIEQILLNLAANARDAMPEGGVLEITLKKQKLENVIPMHISVQPGDYIVLSVSDSGHGMSEEISRQIFEPYFSTKLEDMGTGLGLSVIYGIVQHLKGGIQVDSIMYAGTSFNIYFPITEQV